MFFDIGDRVRLSMTFLDSSGAPADPATVAIKLRTPAGVESTITYPTGIVREGLGVFYYDYSLAQSGIYHWRWVGTGIGADLSASAEEGTIMVRASGFVAP